MMAVCASCVETLAEGHAALGHRDAVPSGVHRVTGVAVSRVCQRQGNPKEKDTALLQSVFNQSAFSIPYNAVSLSVSDTTHATMAIV